MTPRLPPELLELILELGLEDLSPLEQQLFRNRFRLVSKDWYEVVNYWKEVAVVGPASVGRLASKLKLNKLQAERAGTPLNAIRLAIKAAHIDVTVGDDARFGAFVSSPLACLLGLLPSLERLTYVRDRHSLAEADEDGGELEDVALVEMTELEQFCYRGVPEPETFHCPGFRLETLTMLLASWPRLKSLELVNSCLPIGEVDHIQSIYPHNSGLTRVRLKMSVEVDELARCLRFLPATVTNLEIDDYNLLGDHTLHSSLNQWLQPIAPRLLSFTLVDSSTGLPELQEVDLNRGTFDPVIAKLARVKRLTITPSAVANLRSSLSGLGDLTELSLLQGDGVIGGRLKPGEVAEYLAAQLTLARLSLNWAVWGRWNPAGRAAVRRAGEQKGVLVVLQ